MRDYAEVVARAAEAAAQPLALVGWSMGGLVALIAANAVAPEALVLLEPSPPAEAQVDDPQAELVTGSFDPEQTYGAFPPGVRARPESSLARAERKRGISVPEVRCRTLVVSGDDFPEERGRRVARLYAAEARQFDGFSHWDLVLRPEVPLAVADWLRT